MRQLTLPANGFQAFLSFDDTKLNYNGNLSSYSTFPLHVVQIQNANTFAGFGKLQLDGSTQPNQPCITTDSLLATLVFDVEQSAECTDTSITFRTRSRNFLSGIELYAEHPTC